MSGKKIDSPTSDYAEQTEAMGFSPGKLYKNLDIKTLISIAISNGEGKLSYAGSLAVKTGKYTGRSPDDRFIVRDEKTKDTVDWGKINHPIAPDKFDGIFERLKQHLDGKNLYVFDGFVGADPANRLPIRVINDRAWQNLFARHMFIRPTELEITSHTPEFNLICINDFESVPEEDGTNSNVFIMIDLTRKLVLIGGTRYAGEIKKSMFSVMNFILPQRGIFPMHCSANVGSDGFSALFFGLSGTGKTTLSADPKRNLVGDDEHGWSDSGIFNFEGGCYAKCINLNREAEPQIWNAIKDGTVLENVVLDSDGKPEYNDNSLTENTRAAYPLDYIPNIATSSVGGHPKTIVFLTADAMGVLPPLARLSNDGAMYHFMSGYTSKLAGTERGIKEPKAVFSECFGAPFMPRSASVYAKMLGEKILKYRTSVYLINTGWSGGSYGIGERISIKYSRAMVTAAISGTIESVEYRHDDLFNLDIPKECPGVPSEILDPKNTWSETDSYETVARKLAGMFVENFEKFNDASSNVRAAGPNV
ncbi:MAG: phosphoenolpyruvate carboxykinase (ATP) [Cenarchaeum symbiont of Oopsacas minuta]|nr:phosphoenolpyruvate carboxykinase (ATP) [Cenarchaeum symbiont of Oopsacas minuta]